MPYAPTYFICRKHLLIWYQFTNSFELKVDSLKVIAIQDLPQLVALWGILELLLVG
jgi:hypothetical protein